MMNSLGWQTVVATPPTVHQGFITVWPPVTEQPASNAQSLNPLIICKTIDKPILINVNIFKHKTIFCT
jgi:hypothetical protein